MSTCLYAVESIRTANHQGAKGDLVEIKVLPVKSEADVDRRLRQRGVSVAEAQPTTKVFHAGELILELRNQRFIRFRSNAESDLWIATENAPMDLAWSYQDVNDLEVQAVAHRILPNGFEIELQATKPSISGKVDLVIEGLWLPDRKEFQYVIRSTMDADLDKWWEVSRWAKMGAYTSGLPGASLDAFDYHIDRISTPDLLQNDQPLSDIAYDYFIRSDDGADWIKWPKLHVSFTTRRGDYANLNMNTPHEEGSFFGFIDPRKGGWKTRLLKAPDTPGSSVRFMLCWFYMDVHFLLRNAVPPRGTSERFTLEYAVEFMPVSAEEGSQLLEAAEEKPWREMEEFRVPVFSRNNRFDELISGTRETQWPWFASSWDCKWDDTVGYDDQYSVQIDSETSGAKAWYFFSWGFPRDEEKIGGRRFRLTAKVKIESVDQWARIAVVEDNNGDYWLHSPGARDRRGKWVTSEHVSGSTDWQTLTLEFTARGGIPMIVLEQEGPGTTWFDNVVIEPVR
jgi:hypothetical protein